MNEIKLCKCGCGKEIIIKSRHKYYGIPDYLQGHNSAGMKRPNLSKGKTWEELYGIKRANELKQKMSESLRGEKNHNFGKHLIFSDEHRKNISKSKKGKTLEERYGIEKAKEIKQKMSLAQKRRKEKFGHHHSPESLKKQSEKMKGRKFTPEHCLKIKNRIITEETRRNMSESKKKCIGKKNNFYGKKHTEMSLEKMRLVKLGKKASEITKQKMSIERKERWQNPEYRERVIENTLKGLLKRPTSFEKRIIDLCFKFNLKFVYRGNGGFLINFKNPDFVNEKDKIVIEVFYSWFKIKIYGSVENYKEFCRLKYEPSGWKIIFLDENDVMADNWEERCLDKINEVLIRNEVAI